MVVHRTALKCQPTSHSVEVIRNCMQSCAIEFNENEILVPDKQSHRRRKKNWNETIYSRWVMTTLHQFFPSSSFRLFEYVLLVLISHIKFIIIRFRREREKAKKDSHSGWLPVCLCVLVRAAPGLNAELNNHKAYFECNRWEDLCG